MAYITYHDSELTTHILFAQGDPFQSNDYQLTFPPETMTHFVHNDPTAQKYMTTSKSL